MWYWSTIREFIGPYCSIFFSLFCIRNLAWKNNENVALVVSVHVLKSVMCIPRDFHKELLLDCLSRQPEYFFIKLWNIAGFGKRSSLNFKCSVYLCWLHWVKWKYLKYSISYSILQYKIYRIPERKKDCTFCQNYKSFSFDIDNIFSILNILPKLCKGYKIC